MHLYYKYFFLGKAGIEAVNSKESTEVFRESSHSHIDKMKSLVLVVLLAAAATAAFVSNDLVEAPEMIVTHEEVDVSDVPELPPLTAVSAASRRNLSVGTIGTSRLLARTAHIRGAANNVIHVQDITFRTNSLRITAIRVRHVGAVQGATSSIRAGGVGSNFVTIRLQSARSRGYNYQIEVYGR